MSFFEAEYLRPRNWNGIKPLSPSVMARDFEIKPREWYHVILDEADFGIIIRQAFIKWYSVCRCCLDTKSQPIVVKEDDESTYEWLTVGYNFTSPLKCERIKIPVSPRHIHALIHFSEGSSLAEFKRYLTRVGKLLHQGTVFEKMICLDQAVGVLAGLSCRDGAEICTRPFYFRESRKVFDKTWIHAKRNGRCDIVRGKISEIASLGVKDLSRYSSPMELHDKKMCLCARSYDGLEVMKTLPSDSILQMKN